MNIIQVLKLSLKKIKFNKGKSLFVIIPIAIMFGIIVFVTSEASNLIVVAHNGIFSPIQSQNEVLEVNKTNNPFSGSTTDGYTSTDLNLVKAIPNVNEASEVSQLPITRINSSDLFSGKTFSISSLSGLESSYAQLYTSQPFNYVAGQPIPIILNANDFSEAYVDWGGQTTINVDFSSSATPSNTSNLSPIKTRAIPFDSKNLIGQTFTINFGGLPDISDVSQVSTSTGYQFVQKTQAQIDTEKAARQTAISKYWDYTKISTPISIKFIVAGVSQGTDKTQAYIPSDYAQTLMSQYLSYETAARNTTVMAEADQNATYTGLVYDGVSLGTNTNSQIFANIRNQVNNQVSGQINSVNQQIAAQNSAVSNANAANAQAQAQIRAQFQAERAARIAAGQSGGGRGEAAGGATLPDNPNLPSFRSVTSTINQLSASSIQVSYTGQAVSYNIPGLVYNENRTTGAVSGENTTLTTNIPLASNTMLIKLDSITNRDAVVTALNSKGYRYTDFSQYKQYTQLESYVHLILNIATIVFMAVTALFILINMAKFVSEGKKEIGIYRAIGSTKGDIRLLFILQTLAYVILSLIFGAIIGTGVVFAVSNLMVTQANYFINTLVGSTVAISGTITTANFINFDIQTIGLYVGAMLLVTLIVSLIPSGQAAKVSPIEAIRNA